MAKINFTADYYFNNKAKLDAMFGDAVCPVDLNGAYVAVKTDKYGANPALNEEVEDDIRARFGLITPDNDGDENDY